MEPTAIETLLERLNEISPMIWTAMLKQANIEIFIGLPWLILTFIILVWLWAKYPKKRKQYADDDEKNFVYHLLLTIITLVLLIIIGSISTLITTLIFNPEYWAIQKLLHGG